MSHNTILESIRYYAVNTPNQLAVIDETVELTYDAYWKRICGVAAYLKSV